MSLFCSFALLLQASRWGRPSLRNATLPLFPVNVAHPLRRAAYEGAENLSTWGDFAEVGEESLFK